MLRGFVSILQLAMIFFIVTNPIGNSPAIISLIKNHTIPQQQKILLRESLFSMLLAIGFLFLGDIFLSLFQIENYALKMSGGILLFLIALSMIFHNREMENHEGPHPDPYIVPIATPLLSGTGLLTIIMLYSKEEANNIHMLLAIFIAWIGVTLVLWLAPYLQIFLGKRGMAALEQLMGMALMLMSVEMIVQSINQLVHLNVINNSG
jgi:multiple antibiotic resistance protein